MAEARAERRNLKKRAVKKEQIVREQRAERVQSEAEEQIKSHVSVFDPMLDYEFDELVIEGDAFNQNV
jgi:hypothetical protein